MQIDGASKIIKHSKLYNGQSLFIFKCAPLLFKIEKDIIVDDKKKVKGVFEIRVFITCLSSFGSKVFLALKS